MDPNECLRLLLNALGSTESDREEEIEEHAHNLLGWLQGGGFEPKAFEDETVRLLTFELLHARSQLRAQTASVERWEARVIEVERRRMNAIRALEGKT